jgi:hypothetical protein
MIKQADDEAVYWEVRQDGKKLIIHTVLLEILERLRKRNYHYIKRQKS